MAEEPEKTEEGQEAEGQQAEGQAEGQQAEGQTEGEGEGKDQEPKTVPYERFQEVVEQVKQLQEQATLAAQQNALARANPVQGQPQQPQQPQFDIYKEVGAEGDDDVLTVAQQKKVLEHYGKVFDSRLAEIAFNQAHPDYADLVGTVDEIASGKYAEPLAAAIKENPALINDIARSGNPRLAAYNIAKLQSTKQKGKPISKDEAKDAIGEAVENANRVKSSSNAKGGGALSEEGRYATMPDADFLKLAHSHGAFV